MTKLPFRRVVVTGVECSGKTTLSRALAEKLGWGWVPEAARTHADVLAGKVSESTFDDLHDIQTAAAKQAQNEGAPGVICDTGDLVLRMWSEATLEFSWHPLSPPNPSVDLHILCPTLETWEPDPLRNLPRLEDRIALEQRYRDHLTFRPHVIAEGATPEARLAFILDAWPW